MRNHVRSELIDQEDREMEAVLVAIFCVEMPVVVPPLHFVGVGSVVTRKLNQDSLGAFCFVPVFCRLVGGK